MIAYPLLLVPSLIAWAWGTWTPAVLVVPVLAWIPCRAAVKLALRYEAPGLVHAVPLLVYVAALSYACWLGLV